jgi:hypothetical protein
LGGGAGDAIVIVCLPNTHMRAIMMNTHTNGAYALYCCNKRWN